MGLSITPENELAKDFGHCDNIAFIHRPLVTSLRTKHLASKGEQILAFWNSFVYWIIYFDLCLSLCVSGIPREGNVTIYFQKQFGWLLGNPSPVFVLCYLSIIFYPQTDRKDNGSLSSSKIGQPPIFTCLGIWGILLKGNVGSWRKTQRVWNNWGANHQHQYLLLNISASLLLPPFPPLSLHLHFLYIFFFYCYHLFRLLRHHLFYLHHHPLHHHPLFHLHHCHHLHLHHHHLLHLHHHLLHLHHHFFYLYINLYHQYII